MNNVARTSQDSDGTDELAASQDVVPVPAQASDRPSSALASGTEVVVPVVEETARIDKHVVEHGRVRVSTRTKTVEDVLRENLRGNAVGVTRVAIGRTLSEGEVAPRTRTEGGVTIIPVLEEVLVVEKRLVLKEEVHIRETSTVQDVEVPITLRRQHAVIERVSPEGHVTEQHAETSEETNP